jgi:rhodanese-related sulfurtransferase
MKTNPKWVQTTIPQAAALVLMSAIISIGVNNLRPDGIPLIGDWSPKGRMITKSGESLIVPFEQAKTLFESQEAVFLDARPADEYAAGHIQGALNLPWQDFDNHFERIWPHLSENKTFIAYCDGESCSLSKDLASALRDMGFSDVRVLVNGWSVWKNSGLPVTGGGE